MRMVLIFNFERHAIQVTVFYVRLSQVEHCIRPTLGKFRCIAANDLAETIPSEANPSPTAMHEPQDGEKPPGLLFLTRRQLFCEASRVKSCRCVLSTGLATKSLQLFL